MKDIKKIGKAAAGSALLVGATLAGAATMSAAQTGQNQANQTGDLGDYPQPFVDENGNVDTSIVVGEDAKTIDVVGGIEIGGSLGNAAFSENPLEIDGAAFSWEAENGATLDTQNDQLFFLDQLNSVRSVLTEGDLEALSTTEFTDDAGSAVEIDQLLYPGDQQIMFGQPEGEDIDPVLHVENPSDVDSEDFLYQIQANFGDEIDFTNEDVQDEEIELFGDSYTVGTETTADELVLFGSQQEFEISSGESRTITIDGDEHDIGVEAVTSSQTAALRVDGDLRERDAGQTFSLDGQEVRLVDVIQTGSSEGIVQFAIGSEELRLQAGQPIEDENGDEVDGTYVEMNGGTTAGVDQVSSLTVYVGAEDDQEYVEAGDSYSHSLFEGIEFHFGGLNPDAGRNDVSSVGSHQFTATSSDTVAAEFNIEDSESVEFGYTPDGSQLNLADGDNDSIHSVEGANASLDEYFLTDAGDFPHMWEVTGIDAEVPEEGDEEAIVDLEDVHTGQSVEVDLNANGDDYTGIEVIDGQSYHFVVDPEDETVSATWGADSDFGDAGEIATVYPALDTQAGSAVAFTEEISYNQSDGTSQVYKLPSTESTGDAQVNITLDNGNLTAESVSGVDIVEEDTDSATVEVNSGAQYVFDEDSGSVSIAPYDGQSTISGPAAAVVEPEDESGQENVYWEVPSIDSDGDVEIIEPVYTGEDRMTATLETDDDVEAGYDTYGAYTEYDSNGQGEFEVNVPFAQSAAGAAFTDEDGGLSTSDTNGQGFTSQQPTGWGEHAALDTDADIEQQKQDTNMILVGGPAVNELTDELAQDNLTMQREDYEEGEAIIQLVEDAFTEGQDALIVAGYSGEDTRGAANYLTSYDENQGELSGQNQITLDTGGDPDSGTPQPQGEDTNETDNQTDNETENETGDQEEDEGMFNFP